MNSNSDNINHLVGDHPEFRYRGPEPLCDVETLKVQLNDTIALPIVNCGFLDRGDLVEFTATGTDVTDPDEFPTLVTVAHKGFYLGQGDSSFTTSIDCLANGRWEWLDVEFLTELRINGWPVAVTRIPVCPTLNRPDVPTILDRKIIITAQDPIWIVARLNHWLAPYYDNDEVAMSYSEIAAWYRQRGINPSAEPNLGALNKTHQATLPSGNLQTESVESETGITDNTSLCSHRELKILRSERLLPD